MALSLVAAAQAAPPRRAALPSPLLPFSTVPPISGGATSLGERIVHRVGTRSTVHISIDATGTPFAVRVRQRLDVFRVGDYTITIGAPVADVRAAPGSASTPGLRTDAILWAGFNPGHRVLIADATLRPAAVASALPLTIRVEPGRVTFVNTTAARVGVYTADAQSAPLRRYLGELRAAAVAHRVPGDGTAELLSTAHSSRVAAIAPLRVSGTVGGRQVSLLLGDGGPVQATVATHGTAKRISLVVTPEPPLHLLRAPPGPAGAALLDRTMRAIVAFSRERQYGQFLGNPDPTGSNTTSYVYETAVRPRPVAVAPPTTHGGHSVLHTLAVVAAAVLAAAAALTVWARA